MNGSLAAAGFVCCGRLDRRGAALVLHTVPSGGTAPEPDGESGLIS